MNRLQKAQRLLKQSKAKDYYKVSPPVCFGWVRRIKVQCADTVGRALQVLGVSRDADLKTIKKAL